MTWSHYCELLDLTDDAKRSFYEREAANSGWSMRELADVTGKVYTRDLFGRD